MPWVAYLASDVIPAEALKLRDILSVLTQLLSLGSHTSNVGERSVCQAI